MSTVANRLVPADLLDDVLGYSDTPEVLANYSGRSMYGRSCLGIVFRSLSEFAGFLVRLAEDAPALARELADYVQTDSMGTSEVYYFPGFELNGDSAFSDDTD